MSLCTSGESTSSSQEGKTQGAHLPLQQFVWYPSVVHIRFSFEQKQLFDRTVSYRLCTRSAVYCIQGHHDCPLELHSVTCLESVLPMETLTVFVKTKGSCWKAYCLRLGSKTPLLADCKNIKHINSFGNRIKRVNESNERWKQHFLLLVTVLCNWEPLNTACRVPPRLLCEGCRTSGSLCVSLPSPQPSLLKKGIIKENFWKCLPRNAKFWFFPWLIKVEWVGGWIRRIAFNIIRQSHTFNMWMHGMSFRLAK